MIKFSLQHIQNQSPYEILVLENGDFTFVTDTGIHYSISFTEEMEIGGCLAYQFIIRKIEEIHTSHDDKVIETILAIIYEFFRLNLNVLLYICDSRDHREEARNRLFVNWFKKYADSSRFTICTANANIEGQGLYTAIIIENRNPRLLNIKEDYLATSEILANK